MNFTQLQERLRQEILRRIDRGSANGALLARQTGFQPSHISNFLRRRRALSLAGLDRLLAAQMLDVSDLLALDEDTARDAGPASSIPIVVPAAAIHDPVPPPAAIQNNIDVPLALLGHLRTRRTASRRGWSRFVAVRITRVQAAGMQPLLPANSIAVIDRHYNSIVSYTPPNPSVFAVRTGNALQFRIVEFENNRLILRPLELDAPLQLLTLGPYEIPADLVVGRLCLVLAPVP